VQVERRETLLQARCRRGAWPAPPMAPARRPRAALPAARRL